MGREAVVGQGFPVGQQVGAQIRREPGDFVRQALGVQRIGGDDHQHPLAVGQPGDGEGVARTGQRRQVEALARLGLVEGVEGREQAGERSEGGHAEVLRKDKPGGGLYGGGAQARSIWKVSTTRPVSMPTSSQVDSVKRAQPWRSRVMTVEQRVPQPGARMKALRACAPRRG